MHVLKALTMFAIAAVVTLPAEAGDVAHPEKYRQWGHVKSMVLKPGHPLYDAVGEFTISTPIRRPFRATGRPVGLPTVR